MMTKHKTLTEACEAAGAICKAWQFQQERDEQYDLRNLLGQAEIYDAEDGEDEDRFYAVREDGAIGCAEDGENIEWLFLPWGADS